MEPQQQNLVEVAAPKKNRLPIIITLIVVILIALGAAAYFYYTLSLCGANCASPEEQSLINETKVLSEEMIVNRIEILSNIELVKNTKGTYEARQTEGYSLFTVNTITKGDLNNDGLEDAFVWGTGCGASCGSIFFVVLNQGNNTDGFTVAPEGFTSSGAGKYSIESAKILNGILSLNIRIPHYDGTSTSSQVEYKLQGNSLTLTGSLPMICKDEQEGTPSITSISKSSGPIGTTIEIKGCNFAGFESDLNVWIVNDEGTKGILYSELGSTAKSMNIVLKPQACQTDESYRGLPCAAYLNVTPGTYKIYMIPWGKKSNEATFTVTK